MSLSVCFCPFLSVSVQSGPILLVTVQFCPFLSVSVCFCLFLSVSVCSEFFLVLLLRIAKVEKFSVACMRDFHVLIQVISLKTLVLNGYIC